MDSKTFRSIVIHDIQLHYWVYLYFEVSTIQNKVDCGNVERTTKIQLVSVLYSETSVK